MVIPFIENDGGSKFWADPNISHHDCVIRSIAIATDKCYATIWNIFWDRMNPKSPSQGVPYYITNQYLEEIGFKRIIPITSLKLTDFVEKYNTIEFPIIFRVTITPIFSHISVLKDGFIHDDKEWWDLTKWDPFITDIFSADENMSG